MNLVIFQWDLKDCFSPDIFSLTRSTQAILLTLPSSEEEEEEVELGFVVFKKPACENTSRETSEKSDYSLLSTFFWQELCSSAAVGSVLKLGAGEQTCVMTLKIRSVSGTKHFRNLIKLRLKTPQLHTEADVLVWIVLILSSREAEKAINSLCCVMWRRAW